MPRANLTDLTVRSLKEGTYFDAKTPAFGIRVGKQRKTWLVVRGKTRTKTVIGHFPQVSRKRCSATLGVSELQDVWSGCQFHGISSSMRF